MEEGLTILIEKSGESPDLQIKNGIEVVASGFLNYLIFP
jgi:hypothetical protein